MPKLRAPTCRWLLIAGMCTMPATAQMSAPHGAIERAREAMDNGRFSRAVSLLSDHIEEADEPPLDALYLRGIALGERGKHPTLQSRVAKFLERAEADFAAVLARDSLYFDVLLRAAVLRRYEGDFEGAIRLGETQVRLRPCLTEAYVGLLKIYRRYVQETEPAEARRLLREVGGDRARLFVGETYARQGLPYAAEDVFVSLLERPHDVSRAFVLLARARVAFARGDPETGTTLMQRAVEAIESKIDALILFEEIATIVSPAENAAFAAEEDAAGFRHFFETFWAKRDPMPAAPFNARMAEHYRRLRIADREHLFYGFRSWYRSPFTNRQDVFPSTYALGHDYDDRGVIFIRHGEPDDFTMGNAQSWLYEDSLMVFHFAPRCIRGICSVTTHFTPIPGGNSFGAPFVGLDPLDAFRKSVEYIARGLTTDRHRWPDDMRILDFRYVLAAFRGIDGRTLLEIHYEIPVEELRVEADSAALEVGMALHDEAWRQRALYRVTKRVAATSAHADRIQIDLPPRDYHLALHVRSLDTPHLGMHSREYRLPRFDFPGLKLSDVLLADTVRAPSDIATPLRFDIEIDVNPSHRFPKSAGFYLAFEIYDLVRSEAGRTRYTVSYTLRPIDRRGRVRRDEAISLEARSKEGSAADVVEFVSIDTADVPAGSYELVVAVRDELAGAAAERTRTLRLEAQNR